MLLECRVMFSVSHWLNDPFFSRYLPYGHCPRPEVFCAPTTLRQIIAWSYVNTLLRFLKDGVFSGVSLVFTAPHVKMTDMPAGDVAKGEKLFNGRCATCHTYDKVWKSARTLSFVNDHLLLLELKPCLTCFGISFSDTKSPSTKSVQGGATKQGPNLYGLFGRTAGTVPGYVYSPSNKSSGVEWNDETLYEYLLNPKKYIPKTKMNFVSIFFDVYVYVFSPRLTNFFSSLVSSPHKTVLMLLLSWSKSLPKYVVKTILEWAVAWFPWNKAYLKLPECFNFGRDLLCRPLVPSKDACTWLPSARMSSQWHRLDVGLWHPLFLVLTALFNPNLFIYCNS